MSPETTNIAKWAALWAGVGAVSGALASQQHKGCCIKRNALIGAGVGAVFGPGAAIGGAAGYALSGKKNAAMGSVLGAVAGLGATVVATAVARKASPVPQIEQVVAAPLPAAPRIPRVRVAR